MEKEGEQEKSPQEKRLSKKERKKKKRNRCVSCVTEILIKGIFSDRSTSSLYLTTVEAKMTTIKTPQVTFLVSRFVKEEVVFLYNHFLESEKMGENYEVVR